MEGHILKPGLAPLALPCLKVDMASSLASTKKKFYIYVFYIFDDLIVFFIDMLVFSMHMKHPTGSPHTFSRCKHMFYSQLEN